jgi:hypothetical protein
VGGQPTQPPLSLPVSSQIGKGDFDTITRWAWTIDNDHLRIASPAGDLLTLDLLPSLSLRDAKQPGASLLSDASSVTVSIGYVNGSTVLLYFAEFEPANPITGIPHRSLLVYNDVERHIRQHPAVDTLIKAQMLPSGGIVYISSADSGIKAYHIVHSVADEAEYHITLPWGIAVAGIEPCR